MRKILFYYTHEITAGAGGVENVVYTLYKSFTELGYIIEIAYNIPDKGKINDTSIIKHKLPSINYTSKLNRLYLHRLFQDGNFGLIINFAAIFNKASRILTDVSYQEKIPLISTYHNTLDLCLRSRRITAMLMKHKITRKILESGLVLVQKNPLLKNAQYISRHSSASVVIGECYIKQYHKLIDSKCTDLQSIYNPLLPIGSADLSKKENIVLFVGRLEEQKNIIELLKIWSKTPHKNWLLEIVGDGSQKDVLQKLITELKIEKSVILKGHLENPQTEYKKAKIFAMTSFYEGFPMTLIECQHYGCVPIIYDSFPAANEIIQNNKYGRLIPAFNQILFSQSLQELMGNKILIEQLGNSCITQAKKYNLTNILPLWKKLLDKYSL